MLFLKQDHYLNLDFHALVTITINITLLTKKILNSIKHSFIFLLGWNNVAECNMANILRVSHILRTYFTSLYTSIYEKRVKYEKQVKLANIARG